jgi:hypothetical protein
VQKQAWFKKAHLRVALVGLTSRAGPVRLGSPAMGLEGRLGFHVAVSKWERSANKLLFTEIRIFRKSQSEGR